MLMIAVGEILTTTHFNCCGPMKIRMMLSMGLIATEFAKNPEYADENDPFSTLFLRKRCIVIVQKMEYVILTHDRLQPLSLEYRRVEFLPKYVQKCDISRYAIVALGVPPAPQGSRALSASRRFSL